MPTVAYRMQNNKSEMLKTMGWGVLHASDTMTSGLDAH